MPRKKADAIKSTRNSRKNISLTLQNEENEEKSTSTVKKKKQIVTRTRRKKATGSPIILSPLGETESPPASVTKKTRKKICTIKSPGNSKKRKLLIERTTNIKNEKSDTPVKKKICVGRSSGKKEMSGLSSIVDPYQFTASPAASCPKKPRKKVTTTKNPRGSKKKMLAERNRNENNEKSDCTKTLQHPGMCEKFKLGEEVNPSVAFSPLPIAKDFAFPIASSTPRTRASKIVTRKCPRNLKGKKMLAEENKNENYETSDCTFKTLKHSGMCKKSKIGDGVNPSLVFSTFPIAEDFSSPIASSTPLKKLLKTKYPRTSKVSKKKYMLVKRNANENKGKNDSTVKVPQKKTLKTKSSRTSKKRKLAMEQKDRENEESNPKIKEGCNLQLGDREDNVSLVVNISSIKDETSLKEIASAAASSAEQKDPIISDESDSNMKQKKHCDLQSGDRIDNVPFVVPVSSTEDEALRKEIAASIASYDDSKRNCEETREVRCMICFELQESFILTVMPCGHSFHSLCLQTWFVVRKTCPICNPEISTNDNASNNSKIEDNIESSGMNRFPSILDLIEKCSELSHTNRAAKELKQNEDINEFLVRCVICMGTSGPLPPGDSHDQFLDFKLMSCGHNVHNACAETSSGICPVCIENATNENDSIYEFPEEVRCAICLDTVESSDFEYISCCHSFHHQCIRSWFNVRRGEICPVCMVSTNPNAVEDENLYGFLENVKCTICMDIEESSEFQRVPCGHRFHTMCAQTWFQENNYCPTCMKNVSETDDDDVRCVICVDTEESPDFEFLTCCHSFHAVCIQSWLKQRKMCPTCNTPILDTSNIVGYGAAFN